MSCMTMPVCSDTSGRCFARTESGKCRALSEAPEKCRFKKPDKDWPKARKLSDTDASMIYRYILERSADSAPSLIKDPRLAPYRRNRYGYWLWRGEWICNKCGCGNAGLPKDRTIIPMNWAGTKRCPHCGVKMGG